MAVLTGLPRRIVEQNLITAQQAQEILEKSRQDKSSFVAAAVASGHIKSRDIALLASEEFGLPVMDMAAFDFELMPQELVSKDLIEKHRALPLFQRGNRLFVAQSDPSAMMAIDEIKFNKKDRFFKAYKGLVGTHKFSGPNNVTLEYHNAVQRSYTDYYNTVNVRKGYSVTDKADGERNLLVIDENGESYLFNRKNVVKATGMKINMPNTIVDGEYIKKDKNGNPMALFMVFDVYFFNGEDVRNNVLMRSNEERKGDTVAKSRLEYLDEFIAGLESGGEALDSNESTSSDLMVKRDDGIKFTVQKKKFYFWQRKWLLLEL